MLAIFQDNKLVDFFMNKPTDKFLDSTIFNLELDETKLSIFTYGAMDFKRIMKHKASSDENELVRADETGKVECYKILSKEVAGEREVTFEEAIAADHYTSAEMTQYAENKAVIDGWNGQDPQPTLPHPDLKEKVFYVVETPYTEEIKYTFNGTPLNVNDKLNEERA